MKKKEKKYSSESRALKGKGWYRAIISAITLCAFLSNTFFLDVSWAYSREATNVERVDIDRFNLPLNLGHIKDTYQGTNRKTIIHIQDAHCNYSCQKSLHNIIGYFSKEHGIDLALLEGGEGAYDLSIFTKTKDRDVRRKVADYFMRQGEINGAEFYAINNPEKVEIYGIETAENYIENLNAYRKSLTFKDEADKHLSTLTHVITNLKRKVYSKDLKALDEKVSAFKNNDDVDFKDYVAFLAEKVSLGKIDLANYKNIAKILDLLKEEKNIDFKEADRERTILINKLEKSLPRHELEQVLIKSTLCKAGDISNEDFYKFLFKKARLCSVKFDKLPNLVKYAGYINEYAAIDPIGIFDEIDALTEDIVSRVAENNEQKTLYNLDKNLRILKGMLNVSLLRKEFDHYIQNKDKFDVRYFLAFFEKTCPLYELNYQIDDRIENLNSYVRNMEEFYAYATKRDAAFVNNIERKLNKEKTDLAILVTGGFHKDNLHSLFKDKGYSYVEIMPKIDGIMKNSPYFKLLSGGVSPIEEALLPPNSSMQIASRLNSLGLSVWGEYNVSAFQAARAIVELLFTRGNEHVLVRVDDARNILFTLTTGEDGLHEVEYREGKGLDLPDATRGIRLTLRDLIHEGSEWTTDRVIRELAEETDGEIFEDISDEVLRKTVERLRVLGLGAIAAEVVSLARTEHPTFKRKIITGIKTSINHPGGEGVYIDITQSVDTQVENLFHETLAAYFSHLEVFSHREIDEISKDLALRQGRFTEETADCILDSSIYTGRFGRGTTAEERRRRRRGYATNDESDVRGTFEDGAESLGGKGSWSRITETFAEEIGYKPPSSAYIAIQEVWTEFIKANRRLVEEGNKLIDDDMARDGRVSAETLNRLRRIIQRFRLPQAQEDLIIAHASELKGWIIDRSSGRREDSFIRNLAGIFISPKKRDEHLVVQGVKEIFAHAIDVIWINQNSSEEKIEGIPNTVSAEEGFGVVVQPFLSFNASGTAMTNLYGHTAIEAVCGDADMAVRPVHANVAQFLFEKGQDPSSAAFEYNPTYLTTPYEFRLKGKEYQVTANLEEMRQVLDEYPKINGAFSPLDETQARELNRVVNALEEKVGVPLDVEWGFLNGELYIIQIRPIIGDFKKPLVEASAELREKTPIAQTPISLGHTSGEGFTGRMVLFGTGVEKEVVQQFEEEFGKDYIRVQNDVASAVLGASTRAKVLVDVDQGSRQAHNINLITGRIANGEFTYANGPVLREGLEQNLDFIPHPTMRGVWVSRQEVTYFSNGLSGRFYTSDAKPADMQTIEGDRVSQAFHEQVKDIWFRDDTEFHLLKGIQPKIEQAEEAERKPRDEFCAFIHDFHGEFRRVEQALKAKDKCTVVSTVSPMSMPEDIAQTDEEYLNLTTGGWRQSNRLLEDKGYDFDFILIHIGNQLFINRINEVITQVRQRNPNALIIITGENPDRSIMDRHERKEIIFIHQIELSPERVTKMAEEKYGSWLDEQRKKEDQAAQQKPKPERPEKLKVLYLDDDKLLLKAIEVAFDAILGREYYELTIVNNVEDAKGRLTSEEFDTVLFDAAVPDFDEQLQKLFLVISRLVILSGAADERIAEFVGAELAQRSEHIKKGSTEYNCVTRLFGFLKQYRQQQLEAYDRALAAWQATQAEAQERPAEPQKETIFVVNDSSQEAKFLAEFITEEFGDRYDVVPVTVLADSLYMLERELRDKTPNIVITDMLISRKEGGKVDKLDDIMQCIREKNPRARFIVTSEEAAIVPSERLEGKNVAGLAEKPFYFQNVMATLQGLLKGAPDNLLRYMHANGIFSDNPKKSKEIAEGRHFSQRTIQRELEALLPTGLVEGDRNGYYLPEWLRDMDIEDVIRANHELGSPSLHKDEKARARVTEKVKRMAAARASSASAEPAEIITLTQDGTVVHCEAGPELTAEDMIKERVRGRITEEAGVVLEALYELFGGEECYSFVMGAIPTDSNGKKVRKARLASPLTGVRAASRGLVAKQDMENVHLKHTMGVEEAKKAVLEIHERAQKGIPQGRIHCSLSRSVLNSLEEDSDLTKTLETKPVRQFLNENTMLDLIEDFVERGESRAPVILMMPYARATLHGFARLNLAHFIKHSDPGELDERNPSYYHAVELVARTMGYLSNNANIKEMTETLLRLAEGKDPNFLISRIFEINLPPITKVDFNTIRDILDAEAEALRAA